MTQLKFIPAHPETHRAALLELNIEYLQWVMAGIGKLTGTAASDVNGMAVPEYVASVIEKVCGDAPPKGAFYLVELDGLLAGMGGLRWVRPGVSEVKRIYVRPTHRGQRLGQAILRRIVDDATAFGYQTMVLDTAPFMQSAQKIYREFGFVDRGPYEEVEVPQEFHAIWRFMERPLAV